MSDETEENDAEGEERVDETPEPDDTGAGDDTPGTRFHFVRNLGRGVLGAAYEVIDESTGAPVVLKVFLRSRPADPDTFKLSFGALSRLHHPNLAQMYYLVDPTSDTNLALEERLGVVGLAFTEEYVEGVDLLSYLTSAPSIAEIDLLDARRQRTGEVGVETSEGPEDVVPAVATDGVDTLDQSDGPGDVDPGSSKTVETQEDSDSPSTDEVGTLDAESDGIEGDAPTEEGAASSTQELTSGELRVLTRELVEGELKGEQTLEVERDTAPPEAVLAEFTGPDSTPALELTFVRLEHVVPQILDALKYLHKFQRVHGNIRPSNVLVDREGKVKLTDYGLVEGLVYEPPSGTSSGPAIPLIHAPENLPYLAPETDGALTPSSDLYALGCVLFEAISGDSPHDHMEWSTEGGKGHLEPPPLADAVKECPASWAMIVDGLLSRDPAARPGLERIRQVLGGGDARPVVVPATSVPEPTTFVGRDEIVEQLKGVALRAVDERTMTLVQLAGETGIGKSTILKRLSHNLARRGWLVMSGQCYRSEPSVYQGWSEIIGEMAQLLDALPPGVREELKGARTSAGVLFPELRPAGVQTSECTRLNAVDGLRTLLARLSSERPILLILRDLQWASWDSASLLIDLFSQIEDMSCTVIGTWQEDVLEDAESNLLQSGVELSLLDLERVTVRGYTPSEAQAYARATGAELDTSKMRALLGRRYINPLLLRELRHDGVSLHGELERLVEPLEDQRYRTVDLLEEIYERRIASLETRELAVLKIVCVAFAPVEHDVLVACAEAELTSAVLPAQSTEDAIEKAFDDLIEQRLIRRVHLDGVESFEPSQHPCRSAMLRAFSDREEARVSGRIADAIGMHRRDQSVLRFEYELRAGRVARAMDSATDAAEEAEARFAYYRAVRLWRWVMEHEETLPDYSMLRPASELARVEHFAGEHAEAAELWAGYAQTLESPPKIAEVRLKEAGAWLQAGILERATQAIAASLHELGESYTPGVFSGVHRVLARFSAFTSSYGLDAGSRPEGGRAPEDKQRLARIFFFILDNDAFLDSAISTYFEARLARLAEQTGDALILGLARLKSAESQVRRNGRISTRTSEWLEHAHAFLEINNHEGWAARAWVDEGAIRASVGDFRAALTAFEKAEARARVDGGLDEDHRKLLGAKARTQFNLGLLEASERSARRLLHLHRGDCLAAFNGYRLLVEIALLQGELERAVQVARALDETIVWSGAARALGWKWALRVRLRLAQGQPDVAVGELEMLFDRVETRTILNDHDSGLALRLAYGSALCAEAARQDELGLRSADEFAARALRAARDARSFALSNRPRSAAVARLEACALLLNDRPKRALSVLEDAIAGVDELESPLEIAQCAEARGVIMNRLDDPLAQENIEQARDLCLHYGFFFPLILEGWPAPAEASSLHKD